MKQYQKPELELITFATESIADVVDGDQDTVSSNVNNPFGQ